MERVADGLWRWTAPHPDWKPSDGGVGGWERDVACVLSESDAGVVLIDPLAPPPGSSEAERFWSSLDERVERSGRPLTVVVTLHWHERSTGEVADRYRERRGCSVWAIKPVRGRLGAVVTHAFDDGAELPGGAVGLGPVPVDSADDGEGEVEEASIWLPRQRAIVVGDLLVGTPDGLRIWWSDRGHPSWERRVAPFVRRLTELPVEIVLPAHGTPVLSGGRSALERSLAAPPWAR